MWRSAMANRALIATSWLPDRELQRPQLLRTVLAELRE
jgi:hypothetical protein